MQSPEPIVSRHPSGATVIHFAVEPAPDERAILAQSVHSRLHALFVTNPSANLSYAQMSAVLDAMKLAREYPS